MADLLVKAAKLLSYKDLRHFRVSGIGAAKADAPVVCPDWQNLSTEN
jgi:hypothetical protein